jgi:FlaA1/EpsC-like NDP-sugar epimerase
MLAVKYRLIRAAKAAIDLSALLGAYWVAFLVRFEGALPDPMVPLILISTVPVLLLQAGGLRALGVGRSPWRFVDLLDVRRIFLALALASFVLALCRWIAPPLAGVFLPIQYLQIPLGVLVLDMLLGFFGVVAVRVIWRLLAERAAGDRADRRPVEPVPTILVGAGRAGALIAKEVVAGRHGGIRALGFVDDEGKIGMRIHGLPILGTADQLENVISTSGARQALITMANAPGATVRRIVEVCNRCGIEAKIIPDIEDIVNGKFCFSRMRKVAIEDILRRDPVEPDCGAVRGLLEGRTVLVTGAGGSIGSEICRQALRFGCRAVILVERAENSLFHIDRELQACRGSARVCPCIADVLDRVRMAQIFESHRPAVVFHAAAHKHVPMMELNPGEALKNNVLGTKRMAELARRCRALSFVMVSTDKAVRPASIMGASKQLAERYVHALSQGSGTRFVVVRFGNVLGSAGSVVPLFQEQIRRGGPITITHPEMKRYFMTIPEASQLVLQAAAMGKGGEVFVLDMGEPVKIVDLARDLIRLSGYGDDEIGLEFIGTRPGEKLSEELHGEEEQLRPTSHPKLAVASLRPCSLAEVRKDIASLRQLLREPEAVLCAKLKELVWKYSPPEPPGRTALVLAEAP